MIPSTENSLCVVVLGPYRSGTSVTSRVLQRLGVHFGPEAEMFKGDNFNPGGYYERADINRANTEFILSAGFTLADPGSHADLMTRGNRALLGTIDLSWRGESAMWGLKDPRLCATLPIWLETGLLDRARTRFICIQRDPVQITRSVLEFKQVLDYCDGTPEGARAMVDRYLTLSEACVSSCGIPAYRLQYERLITDAIVTTSEIAAFLGVQDKAIIHRAASEIGKRKGLFRLWALDYPKRAILRLKRALKSTRSERKPS